MDARGFVVGGTFINNTVISAYLIVERSSLYKVRIIFKMISAGDSSVGLLLSAVWGRLDFFSCFYKIFPFHSFIIILKTTEKKKKQHSSSNITNQKNSESR